MGTPSKTRAYVRAAERLLDDEGPGEHAAAAGRVCLALFEAFAPVIGAGGVHALLARSVKLAGAEAPCLKELELTSYQPDNDPRVAQRQLVDCLSELEPGAASKAATALYASLFGLMTRFIGEKLVFQIMKRAFPAIDETLLQEIP